MSQINDEILRATGGPTINEGLAGHFGRLVDESLQDAEFRFLGDQGAVGDTIQDRWLDFLGPGQINDLKLVYWQGQ